MQLGDCAAHAPKAGTVHIVDVEALVQGGLIVYALLHCWVGQDLIVQHWPIRVHLQQDT